MTEKEGEAVKSENGPLSYQTPGAEVTIETDLLGDPVKPEKAPALRKENGIQPPAWESR